MDVAKGNLYLPGATGKSSGFTLIELLVVIVIIAILAAMLLPALNKSKAKAESVACLNHLKQLQLCYVMYADDNSDEIVSNDLTVAATSGNSWILGRMHIASESTNGTFIKIVLSCFPPFQIQSNN